MTDTQIDAAPYGINVTKRLVVPAAEALLYQKLETGSPNHSLTLVDYQGGDEGIVRAATAGHGLNIFPENPSLDEFTDYLYLNGIHEPFKWPQFTFKIETSIANALHPVYEPAGNVNEYSNRYSFAKDTSFVPTIEYLVAKGMEKDAAAEVVKIVKEDREATFAIYEKLIDEKGLGLAKELGRIILSTNNDTEFYWKIDLLNLARFINKKERLVGEDGALYPLLARMSDVAAAVAPNAYDTLQRQPYLGTTLTMPTDEDVVDMGLKPSWWESSETKRVVVPELESVMFKPDQFLDFGELQATEYMGWNRRIAEGARTSYGKGTTKKSQDDGLIRYLYRHQHTSPFELVELGFEVKTPVFVDPRQAGRHRTLDFTGFMGNIVMGSQYFMPPIDQLKKSDKINRQGRGKDLSIEEKQEVVAELTQAYNNKIQSVAKLRSLSTPEEIIRGIKGVGFYTQLSRTGDVKNFLGYLGLRLDAHAQKEIQLEAELVAGLVDRLAPSAMEALNDYHRNGIRFSRMEIEGLKHLFGQLDPDNLAFYKQMGMTDIKKQKEVLSIEGIELQKKIKQIQNG